MATATQISDQDIIAVAQQYSLPPALLSGVVRASSASDTFGLSQATLLAYHLSTEEAKADPMLALAVSARVLSQGFAQYGSWSEALSQFLSGDPQAYTSPTSAYGGQVETILGAAAIDPSFGLQGFIPVDARSFSAMASGLATQMRGMTQTGGAVTHDALQQYQQHVDTIAAAGHPQPARVWPGGTGTTQQPTRGANTGGTLGASSVVQGLQAAAQNNAQGYSEGQCTYYAARSLGFIPGGLGNAEDWASNASKMGMQVDSTPAVGTAVVYGPTGPYSPQYGHVAVVTQVNPDGTFQVSEMNVDGQWVVDQRVSSMNGVIGFIHAPAGTDMTKAAPGLAQQVQATTYSTPQQQARQSAAVASGNASTIGGRPTREPQPAQVGEFAAQLQGAGIHPQEFIDNFPSFAAALRRDLQSKHVDVSDYAKARDQVVQTGQPVNQGTLMAAVRSQPHPIHPSVTVGQMADMKGMAMLHSIQHMQQVPATPEVARLAQAGASWKDVEGYYAQKAALRQRAAVGVQPAQPGHRPTVLQGGQDQAGAQPPAGIGDQASTARMRAMDRG